MRRRERERDRDRDTEMEDCKNQEDFVCVGWGGGVVYSKAASFGGERERERERERENCKNQEELYVR